MLDSLAVFCVAAASQLVVIQWEERRERQFPQPTTSLLSFLACNSYDCVAPYVDIILHRGRFWAKSGASGGVRWCCFRSCWTVLSHVTWGQPSCLLQSAGREANRILLSSALSSMRIICPSRVSRSDWIIALSLGCFVSLRTSSFHTNWYHLMPSSIQRHHQLVSHFLLLAHKGCHGKWAVKQLLLWA